MDFDCMISNNKTRFNFFISVAFLLHFFLIMFVSFTYEPSITQSKSMEITITTTPSLKKPEEADFAADSNQEGSGTLEEKATIKTTTDSIFPDLEYSEILLASKIQTALNTSIQNNDIVIASINSTEKLLQNEQQTTEEESEQDMDLDSIMKELASLQAQLALQQQEYAKRPKVLRLNSTSTAQEDGVKYKDEWRKKIEYLGNIHYPEEAKINNIYGQVRMLVVINKDGRLLEVTVLESSGYHVLDIAAQNVVRMAAPYEVFSEDMEKYDQLEIIRTWQYINGTLNTKN